MPYPSRSTGRLPALSRRSLLGLTAAAAVGTLAACGNGGEGSSFGGNATLDVPSNVPFEEVAGTIVSEVDGVPIGLTELPQPRPSATSGVPGSGAPFTTFQINWGTPPRSFGDNEYWQEFNERLGVDYRPDLVAPDAYETRLATLLSGGSVPDMSHLLTDSPNVQQAIVDGAFAELSEVLGGDRIHDYPNLAAVPEHQWRASAVNNGIYGIPTDLSYVNSLHVYRRDWADELGFTEQPADAEEFYELMTGMSTLGSGRHGFGGLTGGVRGFIDSMFRVPNGWREDGGALESALETDEFEQSLAFLRRLWEGGAFHPDALTLSEQGAQDRALFDEGTTGWQVASADNWYFAGTLDTMRARHQGAEPELLLPMGHDGGDYAFPASAGYFGIVAISAEAAKDEDRLHEILSVMDYLRAPIWSEEGFFLRYGLEGVHFQYDDAGYPVSVPDSSAPADRDALFYTGLVPGALYFPNADDVRSAISYTEEVTRHIVTNPAVGLYVPSAASMQATLDDIVDDYVNGIVSGRRPMSDLEKFRSDWRDRGGDTIRTELQDALAEREG
ncbi:hypothetical protein [Pseudactinotalea sp.]|uniref:hypothetical protein n=1 Tax=Pseudactinotalea sp. TaxID=1926260 RepID=UPI003B3B1F9C